MIIRFKACIMVMRLDGFLRRSVIVCFCELCLCFGSVVPNRSRLHHFRDFIHLFSVQRRSRFVEDAFKFGNGRRGLLVHYMFLIV